MFSHSTKEKINGWGTVLRFVTPMLLSIALWLIGDMRNQIRDVSMETKALATTTGVYNTNHLAHHAETEIKICERLASLETFLRVKK